jgi:2-dehydropantoate 2-reductase
MNVRRDTTLIVGTGAMACLFAGRLAAANRPVILLGTWPQGLAAIRSQGVRVVEPYGEQAFPIPATAEPRDAAGVRQAIVLVKSWQTARAAAQLAACLHPEGVALTAQNGLGNREQLAEVLGAPRVALGVTTLGATLLEPGRVRPAGEPILSLSVHPTIGPLAGWLSTAGFTIDTVPDATALLWGKLVINAAINPLTALLGVPNGALLERPTARRLLRAVAEETAAVAAAQGIRLPYPDPAAAAEAVAQRTAANHSSMLQDVRRGAPTEIEAICGAIVAAGQAAGVPTPINRTLLNLVHGLRVPLAEAQPA